MNVKPLFLIPFFLFSAFTYSQDYSTWGEIYDYDIGDEFHIDEDEGEPGWYRRTIFNIQIVDKFVSTNLDTVRYIQFLKCHRVVNPFPWIPDYEEYYEEKVYYNLNSLYIADTTFSNALYNGRKISYTHFTHDQTYEWWHMVDGCGFALKHIESINPGLYGYTKELFYFKKGNEEWGTPWYLTGYNEIEPGNIDCLYIYPNPALNYFKISSNKDLQINQVQIFNNVGKLVLNQSNSFDNINISHLTPDLYIVKIIGDAWTVNRKLIVQ
jgi:hypothetical protein